MLLAPLIFSWQKSARGLVAGILGIGVDFYATTADLGMPICDFSTVISHCLVTCQFKFNYSADDTKHECNRPRVKSNHNKPYKIALITNHLPFKML